MSSLSAQIRKRRIFRDRCCGGDRYRGGERGGCGSRDRDGSGAGTAWRRGAARQRRVAPACQQSCHCRVQQGARAAAAYLSRGWCSTPRRSGRGGAVRPTPTCGGSERNTMTLQVIDNAVQLLRHLRPAVNRIRARDKRLAAQIVDAANSVVLNLGEAEHSDAGNKRARLHTAAGSASEVRAGIRDPALQFVENCSQTGCRSLGLREAGPGRGGPRGAGHRTRRHLEVNPLTQSWRGAR